MRSSHKEGIISTQVVQEFLNVATGKLEVSFQPRDAKEYLAQVLAPLCQVFPTFELYDRAITIRELYGLSFYDSLIVCGALQAGCKTLVTEDLDRPRQTIFENALPSSIRSRREAHILTSTRPPKRKYFTTRSKGHKD